MFSDLHAVSRAVAEGFGNREAVVLGDIMLDRYLRGDVQRISPEAPVPVLRLSAETFSGGGAANVALNLAGLGLRPSLVGVVGNDPDGACLLDLLGGSTVATRGVIRLDGRPTITKTRVLGGHQQMLRIDREDVSVLPDAAGSLLLEAWSDALSRRPAVAVLSDYAKGVLGPRICRSAIACAREAGVPVLVDPKGLDYAKYAGAAGLTPNRAEIALACTVPADDTEALLDAGRRLLATLGLDFLALTRGEEGISLIEQGSVRHFPAMAREVFDVSGAGDTVLATLAAGIAAGMELGDAVHLANLAGGVVVGRVGTVQIDTGALQDAIGLHHSLARHHKICDRQTLARRVAGWRAKGDSIVFTNGCFDLLHAGHVVLLERARREGKRLIVGVNSDASVTRLKGPTRPVVKEEDRMLVLASLACVDAVVPFGEDTPLDLIVGLRPDVLVKGGDYAGKEVVGAREVASWGGRTVLVPLVEGRSSTGIIDGIQLSR